jgi:putative FmdB family regulatory protein
MPIYEFECNNENCEANARFDKDFKISEPHDLDCPFCGESMRKVYSSIGFVPVSGMYAADNRK